MFTDLDKCLFRIVLNYKKIFEEVITTSLKYKINLTKDAFISNKTQVTTKNGKKIDRLIFPFGYQDKTKQKFKWLDNIKEMFLQHMEKYDIKKIFGTDSTIKKLFESEFEISNDFHYVLPYLIAIFNPSFNLVRFQSGDIYYYALVELNIDVDFIFDDFICELVPYKKKASGIAAKKFFKKLVRFN